MSNAKHGDLLCDCPFVLAARKAYETTAADLRRITAAAWTRWEDLPVDARLRWVREPGEHPLSVPDGNVRSTVNSSDGLPRSP